MKAALQGMAVCCNWCTWQVHAQDQHISPELRGDLMLLDTEQMRFSRLCKQDLVLSKQGPALMRTGGRLDMKVLGGQQDTSTPKQQTWLLAGGLAYLRRVSISQVRSGLKLNNAATLA
jgi:hypothetical protein